MLSQMLLVTGIVLGMCYPLASKRHPNECGYGQQITVWNHLWKRLTGLSSRRGVCKTAAKRPAGGSARRTPFWKKPAAETRGLSRWVWGAVEVGRQGGPRRTHALGNKRVTLALLPEAESAIEHKPRGKYTLAQVLYERLGRESLGVADMWPSTAAASSMSGRELLGQVNHTYTFRDDVTGIHTNDIESEWNRLKTWYEKKYYRLRGSRACGEQQQRVVLELHLYEYMYYTNVGRSMADIMMAFRHSASSG